MVLTPSGPFLSTWPFRGVDLHGLLVARFSVASDGIAGKGKDRARRGVPGTFPTSSFGTGRAHSDGNHVHKVPLLKRSSRPCLRDHRLATQSVPLRKCQEGGFENAPRGGLKKRAADWESASPAQHRANLLANPN